MIGPTTDVGPSYSNDGQRIMFERAEPGSTTVRPFVANADGSDVREAFPGRTDLTAFGWAPDSERGVLVAAVAGKGSSSIVNLGTGAETTLNVDLDVAGATGVRATTSSSSRPRW